MSWRSLQQLAEERSRTLGSATGGSGSTGEGWPASKEWSCGNGGWGAGSTSEGQLRAAGEGAGDDQVHLSWILSVLVLWHLMGAQSVLLSRWMCVCRPFRSAAGGLLTTASEAHRGQGSHPRQLRNVNGI